jgi:hypothetical protein
LLALTTVSVIDFDAEFLVIAGGGQHTLTLGHARGGGGAGGYISSVSGEASGGGASSLSPDTLTTGTTYTVTVGAAGSNSQFVSEGITHTAIAGGGAGAVGGSGGGAVIPSSIGVGNGGAGTTGQGYAGGNNYLPFNECLQAQYFCNIYCDREVYYGGGGGAGAVGSTVNGGDGVQSSITGTATYYAGGGAGRSVCSSNTLTGTVGQGQTNYGGGGTEGGVGQDGVIILKYTTDVTISNAGGGLTMSTSVVGSNNVTVITAGTGDIEFSPA